MSAIDSGEQIPTKEQLSRCSRQQIDPVLRGKSNCFRPYQAFCGNGIKDFDEECDCGPSFVCFQIDPCCESSTCRIKPECRHRLPNNRNFYKPNNNNYNYRPPPINKPYYPTKPNYNYPPPVRKRPPIPYNPPYKPPNYKWPPNYQPPARIPPPPFIPPMRPYNPFSKRPVIYPIIPKKATTVRLFLDEDEDGDYEDLEDEDFLRHYPKEEPEYPDVSFFFFFCCCCLPSCKTNFN